MGTIVVSLNSTVDGGFADPTGEEGAAGGGWFARMSARDQEAFGRLALEEALASDAFLMGRRTYAFLASRWPARTGPLADRLNSLDKHVVSTTLGTATWSGTTVIRCDAVAEVAALKQRVAREIVVPASFGLVRTLLEHDLVDELRMLVFPALLGASVPALPIADRPVPLQLRSSRLVGEHLTQSVYMVERSS